MVIPVFKLKHPFLKVDDLLLTGHHCIIDLGIAWMLTSLNPVTGFGFEPGLSYSFIL